MICCDRVGFSFAFALPSCDPRAKQDQLLGAGLLDEDELTLLHSVDDIGIGIRIGNF